MKKLLCALAFAVASIGVGVPAAQADTPRCVTKAEYRQVHRGMAKGRVHRVFDVRGRRVAFSKHRRVTSEIRRYRTCRRRSAVSIAFGNGRLTAKSAVWRHRRSGRRH